MDQSSHAGTKSAITIGIGYAVLIFDTIFFLILPLFTFLNYPFSAFEEKKGKIIDHLISYEYACLFAPNPSLTSAKGQRNSTNYHL